MRPPIESGRQATRPDRRPVYAIALALITACALIARLWQLGQAPTTLNTDELVALRLASHILGGLGPGPLALDANGQPALSGYLQAASLRLFGASVWALRLPAALLGTLAIPLFYLVARRLTRPWPALGATALFASSVYGLSLARSGWINDYALPAELIAIWALMEGMRRQRLALFGVSAVACAVAGYGYAPFRLLPIGFVPLLAFAVFRQRRGLVLSPRGLFEATEPATAVAWQTTGRLRSGEGSSCGPLQTESPDLTLAQDQRSCSAATHRARRRLAGIRPRWLVGAYCIRPGAPGRHGLLQRNPWEKTLASALVWLGVYLLGSLPLWVGLALQHDALSQYVAMHRINSQLQDYPPGMPAATILTQQAWKVVVGLILLIPGSVAGLDLQHVPTGTWLIDAPSTLLYWLGLWQLAGRDKLTDIFSASTSFPSGKALWWWLLVVPVLIAEVPVRDSPSLHPAVAAFPIYLLIAAQGLAYVSERLGRYRYLLALLVLWSALSSAWTYTHWVNSPTATQARHKVGAHTCRPSAHLLQTPCRDEQRRSH